ncbi:hypothetical protein B0H17DRAFT_1209778 [Mycena rosella]|uniref:Uncharacterized protein n=1 Tax=Mycena rosella TaxID=1033263 RepID=A0AAD7D1F6_MYCRO|nr:hypothetical protein B0H17DRAFT_1209778 [Mycena rosella]
MSPSIVFFELNPPSVTVLTSMRLAVPHCTSPLRVASPLEDRQRLDAYPFYPPLHYPLDTAIRRCFFTPPHLILHSSSSLLPLHTLTLRNKLELSRLQLEAHTHWCCLVLSSMAKANLVRRSDRWQDTKLVAPSWNVQHLNLGFLKFLNVWTQTRTPKRSNTFAGTRVTVNVFLPPIIKTSKARRRSLSNELLKGLFPETEHDLYSPGPSLKRRVPSQSCVWCRQTGPNPSPMCLSSAGAENVFSFTPSPLDAFNVDGALQMILIEVHLLNLPAALAASRARFLYTMLPSSDMYQASRVQLTTT